MRVKILNRYWELRFARIQGKHWARCDPFDQPNKEIVIHHRLSPVHELEAVLHEAYHAAAWYQSEEFVEEVAHDLARILWRLGWRKTGETA